MPGKIILTAKVVAGFLGHMKVDASASPQSARLSFNSLSASYGRRIPV